MVRYIAQIISIASYGNEFLNDGIIQLDCRNHSSFHAIGDPAYKDLMNHDFEDSLSTNEWFAYLKKKGCKKIRILYKVVDETKTGVLINESIDWFFETVYDEYSDFWAYQLRYGSGWWAKVMKTGCHQTIINKQVDLELIKRDLEEKLDVMIKYTKTLDWGSWPRFFLNARDKLFDRTPTLSEYYSDLIVEKNYGQLAKQVLNAAVSAWCFTGMGSWSDDYGSPEQSRITRDLFYSVCDAYVAAVNSY